MSRFESGTQIKIVKESFAYYEILVRKPGKDHWYSPYGGYNGEGAFLTKWGAKRALCKLLKESASPKTVYELEIF